jgi:hypothetical protein
VPQIVRRSADVFALDLQAFDRVTVCDHCLTQIVHAVLQVTGCRNLEPAPRWKLCSSFIDLDMLAT